MSAETEIPAPPSRPLTQRLLDLLVWGGIAVLLLVSIEPVQLSRLPLLFSKSSNMHEFLMGFVHPDYGDWRTYVAAMWMTVEIALWGTLLAIAVALRASALIPQTAMPAVAAT